MSTFKGQNPNLLEDFSRGNKTQNMANFYFYHNDEMRHMCHTQLPMVPPFDVLYDIHEQLSNPV